MFVALVAVPAFFVLNAGESTPEDLMRRAGAEQWEFTWGLVAGWWVPIVLLASLGIALVTRGRISRAAASLGSLIARPPRWLVATIIGGIGAALTIWVSKFVFDGRTVVNDASVQLIQARYFAAGQLSGPPLAMPEFWSIQFMIQTTAGWVSQYPPAHAVVLAAGFALGAPAARLWRSPGSRGAACGAPLHANSVHRGVVKFHHTEGQHKTIIYIYI